MTKYRRKPVEIYAIQWNGDNLQEVRDFLLDYNLEPNSKNQLEIKDWTDSGFEGANIGEYIVKEWEDVAHPEDWRHIIIYDQQYFEECFEIIE